MSNPAIINICLITGCLLAINPSTAAEQEPLTKVPGMLLGQNRKLEPDKVLTSGGIRMKSEDNISVEPELGVSHISHQREAGGGLQDITHKVHARAGGKVKLSDRFYLGIATKLPIYNYDTTESHTPGGVATPALQGHHDYEIFKLTPNSLTWTGEIGFQLGQIIDLNLYYDQNVFKTPLQPGIKSEEEIFGTRFILRFK